MSATESVFVDADGIRLRAVIDRPAGAAGSARPIVLLHGFTGGAESMATIAAELACDRPVARLELVGHGESDAPEDVACYAMPACVEHVHAAIAGLGFARPHVLGYSMGGRTALSAAIARPDAFASVVLVGATAGIADPVARDERALADRALADRIERDGLEAFVDHWMALPLFASQKRLGEAALARARAERLRQRPRGLAQSLRGMGAGAQPPVFDGLGKLRRPVLLVVGEEDAKFRDIAASLVEALPDATTEIIPEAGHAAHLEQPAACGRRVAAFLETRGETP